MGEIAEMMLEGELCECCRIPMICQGGDNDPHGVFEFVDAVWMMDEYSAVSEGGRLDDYDCDQYLVEVFPQLKPKN